LITKLSIMIYIKQKITTNFFGVSRINKKVRKGLMLLLVLTIGILNFGCYKDSNDDEYYIKYEVGSSTIYSLGKLDVILSNEKNLNTTLSINTKSKWEAVVGPVKKGFKANIEVSEAGNNHGKLTLSTQISVSKNNGPFALKAIDDSDDPRTNVQLGYAIDF
jgi:hypothetical protein